MSEPIYIDHVPELLSWPEGQRRLVSRTLGLLMFALQDIHDGCFLGAATHTLEARNAVKRLRRLQRESARRCAEKTTEPALTAGKFRRV